MTSDKCTVKNCREESAVILVAIGQEVCDKHYTQYCDDEPLEWRK